MSCCIRVPTLNLYDGPAGIEAFLAAVTQAWSVSECVDLDCSQCGFISAEGVAVLASLRLYRDRCGLPTRMRWETVRPAIAKQMGRWGLTGLFGMSGHPWTDSAIPILHQPALDKAKVVDYISRWTRVGQNMPIMTEALAKEVRRSLCELFVNIFQHSDSAFGGIALGQYYPKQREVQICVCDGGVGIVHRIQSAGFARSTATAAIDWALESGNTTRPLQGCPGGLGLYLLREFVKANGGTFRIYANAGFFQERAGLRSASDLKTGFPGTLIELRLNLSDTVVYGFRSELRSEAMA